jgi:hypothetical protein
MINAFETMHADEDFCAEIYYTSSFNLVELIYIGQFKKNNTYSYVY